MRRKFSLTVLALFAAVLLSTPAAAQNLAGAWSITPFAGGYTYDSHYNDDTNLSTSLLYGLRIGYNLTKRWSIEAVGTYANSFGDDPVIHNGDRRDDNAKMFGYRMEGLYHFLPHTDVALFLAAGLGGRILDYDIKSRSHRFLLGYGGGFKYFFAEHWALRGDVRHLYAPNADGANNFEYTLGVSFVFGGKKEELPGGEPNRTVKPIAIYAEPDPITPPEAPPVIEVHVGQDPIRVVMRLNVLFDFDKDDVKPKFHGELKKVADYLKEVPNEKVTLEGHTDSKGSHEYNMKLSQRRVENVKKYLADNFGVNPNRMTAIGYGKTRPIADNSTAEGRQLNRRVDAVMENYIRR